MTKAPRRQEPLFCGLAQLGELRHLQLRLDATLPGLTTGDILHTLRALLGSLPHCWARPASPLRLSLGLELRWPRPELEAWRLHHLLAELRLLPRLAGVEVRKGQGACGPAAGLHACSATAPCLHDDPFMQQRKSMCDHSCVHKFVGHMKQGSR